MQAHRAPGPEQRALTASMVSLVAALAGIAMFLPPLLEATLGSALRIAVTGAGIGCALLLHWIFLGLAASRMQRSVPAWVGFSVLLFPIGSATALMLLSAFSDNRAPAPAPVPSPR
jgi:hypothetical protein